MIKTVSFEFKFFITEFTNKNLINFAFIVQIILINILLAPSPGIEPGTC